MNAGEWPYVTHGALQILVTYIPEFDARVSWASYKLYNSSTFKTLNVLSNVLIESCNASHTGDMHYLQSSQVICFSSQPTESTSLRQGDARPPHHHEADSEARRESEPGEDLAKPGN